MNVAAALMSWIQSSMKQLLDFAFPPQCAVCGTTEFPADPQSTVYCETCVNALCPAEVYRCVCCGAEIGLYAKSDKGCPHCRNRKLRFESVVCLGMYEGTLRQAILAAKWSYSPVRMRALARLLARHQATSLKELQIDRVIPVPQHWRQRLVRHFNPASIIGTEVADSLGIPCDALLLKRHRRTRPQKRVAVSQRFENQADAFSVKDAHIFRNQRLLLIDDVLTTGATCSVAAELLKKAGARSCHVAVLGRVLDNSG